MEPVVSLSLSLFLSLSLSRSLSPRLHLPDVVDEISGLVDRREEGVDQIDELLRGNRRREPRVPHYVHLQNLLEV